MDCANSPSVGKMSIPGTNAALADPPPVGKMSMPVPSPPQHPPSLPKHQPFSWVAPIRVASEGNKAVYAGSEKLIIAIDFGTTFTGVAYGLMSDKDNVTVITEWPGTMVQGRNDTVKIPSIIKYGIPKDETTPVRFDWGHNVGANDTGVIRGIKLALDPEKRKSVYGAADDVLHHEATITEELIRLEKTTVDIISDYIGAVYKHALAKIREIEYGPHIDKLTKEFVLTVPAIWSDRAKNATLNAARKAHILVSAENLITEPEAAALFASQTYKKRGLKKGDSFVLCDAGGGTVDLISYQVSNIDPRLELKELVAASGGLFGSMMINTSFEIYLKNILGDSLFNDLKIGDGAPFNSIMNDFETKIKPNFASAEQWDELDRYNLISFPGIRVPDDPENNIRENVLTVTGDVLDKIFNPLVTRTEELLQAQLREVKMKLGRPAQMVFLVGGFGASPYLKRRIQVLAGNVDVVQPREAWSAILIGAVTSRMPRSVHVKTNVAPQHLGVRVNMPFQPHEHSQEATAYKFMDPYEGIERITQMRWFILKDAELERDEKIRFKFYRDVPFDYTPKDLKFEASLEASDADSAPKYPLDEKGDLTVTHKCKLLFDLSTLSKDQLTERTKHDDGTKYYTVEYDLAVTVLSAMMTFSAEINRVEYGSVEVEYLSPTSS